MRSASPAASAVTALRDEPRDLVDVERTRRDEVLRPLQGVHLPGGRERRRRQRRGAARLIRWVGDTTDVPQLQEDAPARGVYRIGDAPPARHLHGVVAVTYTHHRAHETKAKIV